MIINNLTPNKIKILANNIDLKNAGIEPEKLISNNNQILLCLNKLLKSNTNYLRGISIKRLFYLYI